MRIGIDLGGTKTEGVLVDSGGSVVSRKRYPTPGQAGYSAILDQIISLVYQLEAQAGQDCSVGVAAPGALTAEGRIKNSNTQCLIGEPFQEDLSSRLGRPVRIENDANCFALAEALSGAGRGMSSVFGVIMGTGVGGGMVIRQRLHTGLQHIAGEWGHNSINPDGPSCYCGQRGCIETYLSGPGFLADYRRLGGVTAVTPEAVVCEAEAKNPIAEQALDNLLERFGKALAGVINILDPHVIVLGGGLSKISQLYDSGPDRIARYVFNPVLETPVRPNLNGDSAGVLGAASLWDY
ncbi:MAG TPA: fructokinase [Gammaproteobacteria bacterium]|nr:fructokinase [Gammaproteobacteria bacterium]